MNKFGFILVVFGLHINFLAWASLEVVATDDIKKCEPLALKKSLLPDCPPGPLVPENYPAAALIFSDQTQFSLVEQKMSFSTELVTKASIASLNLENPPKMVFYGTEENFLKIKMALEALDIPSHKKRPLLANLLHVDHPVGYTWAQDFFHPFLNPTTGTFEVRQTPGYEAARPAVQGLTEKIVNQLNACELDVKPEFSGFEHKTLNALSGGNLVGLPGGFCILGDGDLRDGDWEKYASDICGGQKEMAIKAPTSWLVVGHADEIVKVLPDRNKTSPCDFAIATVSPTAAAEILYKSPNRRFFDGIDNGVISTYAMDALDEKFSKNRALRSVCETINSRNRKNKNQDPNRPSQIQRKGVSRLDWLSIIFNSAHANLVAVSKFFDCAKSQNESFNQVYSSSDLKVYNQQIESEMLRFKTTIARKIKSKLPQCNPEFIELPTMFAGGGVSNNKPTGRALLGKADSIFPSPVNSVVIGNTVLVPDPYNPAFRDDIVSKMKRLGLNVEFIDTYQYAHLGAGNLHCATKTIPMCRSKGRK